MMKSRFLFPFLLGVLVGSVGLSVFDKQSAARLLLLSDDSGKKNQKAPNSLIISSTDDDNDGHNNEKKGLGLENRQGKKRFDVFPDQCSSSVIHTGAQKEFSDVYEHGTWGATLATLQDYYTNSHWPPQDRPSASGGGSDKGKATEVSLDILRKLITAQNITSMIDMPCGDTNWIFESVETDHLPIYIGLDIVPQVIQSNVLRFEYHTNKVFRPWDGAQCPLPKFRKEGSEELQVAQLVQSRDVLQHLPLELGLKFTCNVIQSGARYWVATTWQGGGNRKIQPGKFFPNNLFAKPFDLPKSSVLNCTLTHPHIERDETCVFDLTLPWVSDWISSHCKPTLEDQS